MAADWFVSARSAGETRLRLLCFPYAGGSASVFHTWARALPPGLEVLAVRLPGRADRWREPPFTRLDDVVDALAAPVARYAGEPFAFYGHSVGALVSFELARRLRRDVGREPDRLFVASCSPPLPDRPLPMLGTLDDAELRAKLADFGLAADVLAEDELMEVLLPLIRADLGIADGYVDRAGEPLSCPVTAFRGERDAMLPAGEMELWSRSTSGRFALRTVSGSHVFDEPGWREVLRVISGEISEPAPT